MQASSFDTYNNCIWPSPIAYKKSSRLRRLLWHAVGAAALATALIVQSVHGAVTPASYSHTSQQCSISQVLPSAGSPASGQFFSVTGKVVRGEFLQTFNRFGLQSVGYPLSEERQEDGMTVQYFERVRMEYHPDMAAKGYSVLMTRLGVDLSKSAQPFAQIAPFRSTKTAAYIKETSHSLSGAFLSYWKTKGAVNLFGYPISEPMMQNGLLVQWFERARFEYHPELAARGQAVQLGLLGRDAFTHTAPRTAPSAPAAAPQAQTPPAPKAPQVNLGEMESYLLNKVNEQRAAAGLGQVQLSSPATDLARSRSGDMAERNYFSHTTPEGTNFLSMLSGRGIAYKFAGEILARNNYPDDQATQVAMDSYLNSPAHKAIIMDGRYNTVGVGYAKSGEDAMHYFTVIFVQQ